MKGLKSGLRRLMQRTGAKPGDLVIMAAVLLLTLYILVLTLSVRYISPTREPLQTAETPAETGAAPETPQGETAAAETEPAAAEETTEAETEAVSGDPVVEQALADMTLEEKIYQLFIVSPESLVDNAASCVTESGNMTKAALESKPVGGIIYFSQNLQSRQRRPSLQSKRVNASAATLARTNAQAEQLKMLSTTIGSSKRTIASAAQHV